MNLYSILQVAGRSSICLNLAWAILHYFKFSIWVHCMRLPTSDTYFIVNRMLCVGFKLQTYHSIGRKTCLCNPAISCLSLQVWLLKSISIFHRARCETAREHLQVTRIALMASAYVQLFIKMFFTWHGVIGGSGLHQQHVLPTQTHLHMLPI